MCGRFVLTATPEQLQALFELTASPYLEPRYNIAPTQPVAIVRHDPQTKPTVASSAKAHQWAHVAWGLIPSWAKDPTIAAQLINARCETVAEKPSFRAAFKRRRCLVPATGFYEWQKQAGGAKQPYFISLQQQIPFAIAGLWETWHSADGSSIETCTLLTTTANDLMEPLHNRMPVILAPEDYGLWLGSGKDDPPAYLDQLQHLWRPFPSEKMQAYPVSSFVSNARHEGPQCMEPLDSKN